MYLQSAWSSSLGRRASERGDRAADIPPSTVAIVVPDLPAVLGDELIQFVGPDGFGEVVVHAGLQASSRSPFMAWAVMAMIGTWLPSGSGARIAAGGFEAVHLRHLHIHQDQVERLRW